jgi:lipoic acid synthetase
MIIDLGLTDYEEAYRSQMELVSKRKLGEISDSVILTEHKPVFTIGRSGGKRNLLVDEATLKARGLKVLSIDRGGDITFHGPGQTVFYPIIDLKSRGRDLHRYMRDLESVVIGFLNGYGIIAERLKDRTGVWVGPRKIASVGIGVSNWVTYHGLSVNIDVDLSYFSMIYPCGMRGAKMTSLSDILGVRIKTRETTSMLLSSFQRIFNVKVEPLERMPEAVVI